MSDSFVIILHQPRDVRNIGAVVRAMKNMGFSRLRLVAPAPFDPADIGGIAHRSEDLLASMETYATLDTALADLHYVVGTSARHHERPVREDVRTLASELVGRAEGHTIGLLFGPEDNGLDTSALDRCNIILRLPVNPAYPSLNLAQAVLLLLYELRNAPVTTMATPPTRELADRTALETCFTAFEQLLTSIEFVKSGSIANAMRPVRELIHRAEPGSREIAMLTAIAREAVQYIKRIRP
jgi:tRNA/rRNA methyltransferase